MESHPRNLIVYKITYLPWIDNNLGKPWLYIGSTSKSLESYFGSVSSKEFKNFWRDEVKNHPEHFKKEVLVNCIKNDKTILLELEEMIQREFDVVKSSQYFNKAYANIRGVFGRCVEGSANPMYGVKRTQEWKTKHSELTTNISKNPETKAKRSIAQKDIQNRTEVKEMKSKYQKQRWKSNDAGVQRNKDAWCPRSRVYFNDFVFLSTNDFSEYIKENNYNRILSRKFKEYQNLRISDLDIIQQNIDLIGLNASYDIFDVKNILELDKIKMPKLKKTRLISDLTKISFNIVPRILKKFKNKLDEIEIVLKNIELNAVKFPLISEIGATK